MRSGQKQIALGVIVAGVLVSGNLIRAAGLTGEWIGSRPVMCLAASGLAQGGRGAAVKKGVVPLPAVALDAQTEEKSQTRQPWQARSTPTSPRRRLVGDVGT